MIKNKKFLMLAVGAFMLFAAFIAFNKVYDIASPSTVVQSAAWFGVGDDKFEPVKVQTTEQTLSSNINWSIAIFVLLVVLVIANVFDISGLAARLSGKENLSGNNVNKYIMIIFLILGFIGVYWEFSHHGKYTLLRNSSSEHGVEYDSMFNVTLILTMIVFVITQALLFWFSFKYAKSPNRKAVYHAHNNKLEVFWTLIPAIVLTFLVLKGHQTWRAITYNADKSKSQNIEIFAYQFGWKARYAGADKILGAADYKYISGANPLGIAVKSEVEKLKLELDTAIMNDRKALKDLNSSLSQLRIQLELYKGLADRTNVVITDKEIARIVSGEVKDELEESIRRKSKQLERMKAIEDNKTVFATMFNNAADDDVISTEIHLIENRPVTFIFRSRDIIHSAFLPYFRVQMNVVPGMMTQFTFTPTKSTTKIRSEKNDNTFDYYLYCNKICGTSHYNMKIKVIIESESAYNTWMQSQKTAFGKEAAPMAVPVSLPSDTTQMRLDSLPVNKLQRLTSR
ncbi:MAG: cytochrome c oxidase subunit II [Bacteroidia bacterium]|nr:cytochrome c oxidase subunit II [Bacteroidia bacterium]